MRNSIWHCTLVVIATLSVAFFSTGCRSGGWGMPGSSWVSWGKKKPPTSSIAGTREVPKPPSISVPPYPSSDTSATASIAGMGSTSPAASSYGMGNSSGNLPPGGYGVQQTGGAEGYATGPYNTGRGSAATVPTQQGFYSPTYSPQGGPVASTADARGGAYPNAGSGYGTMPLDAGYPAPASYGPAASGGTQSYVTDPAADYGAASGYGAAGYGTAGQSYPPMPSSNDYSTAPPTSSYPSMPANGSAYPSTETDSYQAPVNTPGGYPSPYNNSPYGNATPAAEYGANASGYAAPTPYAPYSQAASGYGAATTSGLGGVNGATGYGTAPYGATTSSGNGYSTGDQTYRPGSTGRNSDVLGTGGSYPTSSSDSSYPSTYAR